MNVLFKRYGEKGRMMKSRYLAREIAQWNGYFWLPCPLCKQDFAGFETFQGGVAITTAGTLGVCSRKDCKEAGAKQKAEMYRLLEELEDRHSQAEYTQARRQDDA